MTIEQHVQWTQSMLFNRFCHHTPEHTALPPSPPSKLGSACDKCKCICWQLDSRLTSVTSAGAQWSLDIHAILQDQFEQEQCESPSVLIMHSCCMLFGVPGGGQL